MGHRSGGKIGPADFLTVQIENRAVRHGAVQAETRAGRIAGEIKGFPQVTGRRADRERSGHGGVGKCGRKAIAGFQIGADGLEIRIRQSVLVNEHLRDIPVETLVNRKGMAADDDRLGSDVITLFRHTAFHYPVHPDFITGCGRISPNRDDLELGGRDLGGRDRATEAGVPIITFLKAEPIVDSLQRDQRITSDGTVPVKNVSAATIGDASAGRDRIRLADDEINEAGSRGDAGRQRRTVFVVAVEPDDRLTAGSGSRAERGISARGGVLREAVSRRLIRPGGEIRAVGDA